MLRAENLLRTIGQGSEERTIFAGLNFILEAGEVVFVVGPSGGGKSLFLRALAGLDEQSGSVFLDGKTPSELGYPAWRSEVCYISQARWSFPGTPRQTFDAVRAYASQKHRPFGDLDSAAAAVGLTPELLDRQWSTLSGGQAQRCQLVVGSALRPRVLLLDEPTSALDASSVLLTEAYLRGCGAALVWVTHDAGQPERVGGRVLRIGGDQQPPA